MRAILALARAFKISGPQMHLSILTAGLE